MFSKNINEEKKEKITVLDISDQELKEELSLEGFENLQVLICSHNELTKINFDKESLKNLIRFDCSYNRIKEVNFSDKADNLEKFIANDNNFSVDIEFLNKLNPERLLYLDMRN